jgi:tetratricopeptide (TPR) repeat protein
MRAGPTVLMWSNMLLMAGCPAGSSSTVCSEHPAVREDLQRGRAWMAEGRYARARLAFTHARGLCPLDVDTALLADMASVAVAAETPEKITDGNINELDYALEVVGTRFPEHQHLVKTARGNIQARAGNGEEAIRHYREALAVKADFVPAMQFQAQVLLSQGKAAEADAVLRAAIRLDRMHVPTRELLAGILVTGGNLAEAADVLREAIANNPRASTHVMMAELARRNSKPADAEASYRAALAQKADDAPALFGLAAVLLEAGRTEDAAPVLLRYLDVAAEQGEPGTRRGEAQRALQQLSAMKAEPAGSSNSAPGAAAAPKRTR